MSYTEWLCLEEVDVGSKELMVINLLLGTDAKLPICLTELGMSMRSLGRRQLFFFILYLLGTIASLRASSVCSKHRVNAIC